MALSQSHGRVLASSGRLPFGAVDPTLAEDAREQVLADVALMPGGIGPADDTRGTVAGGELVSSLGSPGFAPSVC
jgi:hypothetical protein